MEAGHRRVRAYALAWGKMTVNLAGSSRMSCYRMLKSEGLLQPKRIGHDLRQAAEQRRQRLKTPREDQPSFAERLYRLRERRWRETSDRLCDRVLESV